MKVKMALVVVLYNDLPQEYIFENIGIPKIIIDNTPQRILEIRGDGIYYIPLGDNFGIAKALNIGFNKAKEFGVDWVLTMDQDSLLPPNMIYEYEKFIYENHPRLGIISPLINMYHGEKQRVSDTYCEIDEALTSGSLICMDAYDAAGGFKNELFIDAVDFEFCWNIKSKGYKVYQLNKVLMQHQLGNTQEIKIFGKHLFYVTHHNYIRRYYMTRNGLYVRKKYEDIMPRPKFGFLSDLISLLKIIFFEEDALRKIKARRLGIKDYKENKFGKFDYIL